LRDAVWHRFGPLLARKFVANRRRRVILLLDSARTKREHSGITSHGIIARIITRIIVMSASSRASVPPPPFDNFPVDNSHYEQACDQAIALCDGNLRSTIKALIMANEYLEAELMELQAAISSGCMPKKLVDPASNAA
jgi:hypothetical protein